MKTACSAMRSVFIRCAPVLQVGDSDRGFLLELMLTKLRFQTAAADGAHAGAGTPGSSCQIIGMSATIPNVAAVAAWLSAELFITDFRPVPLEKRLLVRCAILLQKHMDLVPSV